MTEMKLEKCIDLKDVLLIYKDKMSQYFIGHSFYYGGRDAEYLMFLYKDRLPIEMGLINGWNYLDDHSVSTVIVSEANNQIAIEDFLYGHGLDKNWRLVHFNCVKDFSEMAENFKQQNMQCGEVIGYVVKGK